MFLWIVTCHRYIIHRRCYGSQSALPGHILVLVMKQKRCFNPLYRFSLTCKTGCCSVNIEAALGGHRCVWSLQSCLNVQPGFAYRTERCCPSIFMKTLWRKWKCECGSKAAALLTPPGCKSYIKILIFFFCIIKIKIIWVALKKRRKKQQQDSTLISFAF